MFGSVTKRHILLFVPKNGLGSVITPARGLATHTANPIKTPSLTRTAPAVLHLKTGQSFTGKAFGSPKSIFGETVFSTSITSCTSLAPLSLISYLYFECQMCCFLLFSFTCYSNAHFNHVI